MSAATAGYLSAMASVQKKSSATDDAAARTKKTKAESAAEARSTGLDALVGFIPTEALTLYIAGVAVIVGTKLPNASVALVLVLIVAAVANFLLGLQSFMKGLRSVDPELTQNEALGTGLGSGAFWGQLLITEVAFVLYVLALPASPLLALWHIDPGWAGLLVVLVAPIFGIIGKSAGLVPEASNQVPATARQAPEGPKAPAPPKK